MRKFFNIEILAYEDTPLGLLCLRRRALLSKPDTVVTEVTLNHEFLMSSHNTLSERRLASEALEMTPKKDLRVFVGGLGLGYTAAEVLADDRVAQVDVIEFLPQVTHWLKQGLIPLAARLNNDSRLAVHQGDVYQYLLSPPKQIYDAILIDVDHSPEDKLAENNAAFYTRDGLEKAKKHLSPKGVLGVWSYAEDSPFSAALHEVFDEVRVSPVHFINELLNGEKLTDWLFFAR